MAKPKKKVPEKRVVTLSHASQNGKKYYTSPTEDIVLTSIFSSSTQVEQLTESAKKSISNNNLLFSIP